MLFTIEARSLRGLGGFSGLLVAAPCRDSGIFGTYVHTIQGLNCNNMIAQLTTEACRKSEAGTFATYIHSVQGLDCNSMIEQLTTEACRKSEVAALGCSSSFTAGLWQHIKPERRYSVHLPSHPFCCPSLLIGSTAPVARPGSLLPGILSTRELAAAATLYAKYYSELFLSGLQQALALRQLQPRLSEPRKLISCYYSGGNLVRKV